MNNKIILQGIADGSDNCPLVANAGQENSDGDSWGDACDNCPNTDNENQADTNENKYGDACDVVGATNIDEYDTNAIVHLYLCHIKIHSTIF